MNTKTKKKLDKFPDFAALLREVNKILDVYDQKEVIKPQKETK